MFSSCINNDKIAADINVKIGDSTGFDVKSEAIFKTRRRRNGGALQRRREKRKGNGFGLFRRFGFRRFRALRLSEEPNERTDRRDQKRNRDQRTEPKPSDRDRRQRTAKGKRERDDSRPEPDERTEERNDIGENFERFENRAETGVHQDEPDQAQNPAHHRVAAFRGGEHRFGRVDFVRKEFDGAGFRLVRNERVAVLLRNDARRARGFDDFEGNANVADLRSVRVGSEIETGFGALEFRRRGLNRSVNDDDRLRRSVRGDRRGLRRSG